MRTRSGANGGTFRGVDDDKLVEPANLEVDGLRWAVARVAPGTERRVTRDLAGEGYRPYCPLGRKLAIQGRMVVDGVKCRRRVMREFVVFAPYLFIGCAPGHEVGREIYNRWGERVGVVLSDAAKPTFIASRIIAEINKLEVAGQWWDNWRVQTHLRTGECVRVIDGPFADLQGIVEAFPAVMRVTVRLALLGGDVPTTLNACQVEAA